VIALARANAPKAAAPAGSGAAKPKK
jgi:hypothetical protein